MLAQVYRKELTDEIHLYGEMHRFISVLADSLGARVGEEVVNHRARSCGASKYGLMRTVKVVLEPPPSGSCAGTRQADLRLRRAGRADAVGLGASGVVLYEKLEEGVWVHRNPLFLIA